MEGLFWILLLSNLPFTLSHIHQPRFNFTNSTSTPLQPYLFGSVSTPLNDDYWLSPRSSTCECFDPTDTCCINSPTGPPFCISGNLTCCASTSCSTGQTCCANTITGNQGCCPPETICTVTSNNIEGCCPIGSTCSGGPVCYNYLDERCLNSTVEGRLCCPVGAPYCLINVQGYGTGCFVNDTNSLVPVNISQSTLLPTTNVPISRALTSTDSTANSSAETLSAIASSIPTKIELDTSSAPSLPSLGTKTAKSSSTTENSNAPNLCWNTKAQALATCSTGQATNLRKSSGAISTIMRSSNIPKFSTTVLFLLLQEMIGQ